ncbi:hypothetical protein [Coleofasciculus sp. E1-EBD-02]
MVPRRGAQTCALSQRAPLWVNGVTDDYPFIIIAIASPIRLSLDLG